MRGHHPDDVLKVHTPIIELLLASPVPEELIDAVATSLIAAATESNLVRSVAAAGRLLSALRENIHVPGKIKFPLYFNDNSDYPSCVVMLASGDVSVKLWARVDMQTGNARLSPMPDDRGTKPQIITSLKQLQVERQNAARIH